MIQKLFFIFSFFAVALALPTRLRDFVEIDSTIVNGTDAKIEEFPWIVSLQYSYNETHSFHYCGGSILSKFWILTVSFKQRRFC